MTAPKLRIIVQTSGQTTCGRPGCDGWFGMVALVDGRPVHLLDPEWSYRHTGYWRRTRSRHPAARMRVGDEAVGMGPTVRAILPEAVLECPHCRALQRLPEGTADALFPLNVPSVDVSPDRIRRL